ncbi:hypothetical protein P4S72_13700 [Vibrio sp. PP-XX7]
MKLRQYYNSAPEVIDALVVALDSASGEQHLVAYYIPKETGAASAPVNASTIERLKNTAQCTITLLYGPGRVCCYDPDSIDRQRKSGS